MQCKDLILPCTRCAAFQCRYVTSHTRYQQCGMIPPRSQRLQHVQPPPPLRLTCTSSQLFPGMNQGCTRAATVKSAALMHHTWLWAAAQCRGVQELALRCTASHPRAVTRRLTRCAFPAMAAMCRGPHPITLRTPREASCGCFDKSALSAHSGS